MRRPLWGMSVETELVIRAQRGDRAAFGLLAAEIATRFLGVSRRILRDIDLAEDASQQALVAIWRDLPRLRDPARFDAWSYRVHVRAYYSEGRRSRLWSPNIRVLTVDERAEFGGIDAGSCIETSSNVRSIVCRWTTGPCSSGTTTPTSGRPGGEILEIPVGTVASRLHHAMRAMRAALDADERLTALDAAERLPARRLRDDQRARSPHAHRPVVAS